MNTADSEQIKNASGLTRLRDSVRGGALKDLSPKDASLLSSRLSLLLESRQKSNEFLANTLVMAKDTQKAVMGMRDALDAVPALEVRVDRLCDTMGKQVPKASPLIPPTVVCINAATLRKRGLTFQTWLDQEDTVYIGRYVQYVKGTFDSDWRNIFSAKQFGREGCIEKYLDYIDDLLKNGKLRIEDLSGKEIGCWCKPKACHGDVLVELFEAL